MRLAGGAPETIGSLPPGAFGGLAWGDDDTIWIGTWDYGNRLRTSGLRPGLYRVSAAGGVPALVTSPEPGSGVVGYIYPRPLPDGRGVLYQTSHPDYESSIGVYLRATDEYRILGRGTRSWFVSGGHVVFSDHEVNRRSGIGAGGVLWALPFDLDRLEPTGEPVRVREGVHATTEHVPRRMSEVTARSYTCRGPDRTNALSCWWIGTETTKRSTRRRGSIARRDGRPPARNRPPRFEPPRAPALQCPLSPG